MMKAVVWGLTVLFVAIAGWTDWRSRRIPNWLTVPGLVVGIAANSLAAGWDGAKASLLGAGLGLGLLLPFVLIRSFGAGDWKLVGGLGAFLGASQLLVVLLFTIIVNAIMAVILVIWHRRVRQTVQNVGHLMASLATFRMPRAELSIDDPATLKVPFGVAVAITVITYVASMAWRVA